MGKLRQLLHQLCEAAASDVLDTVTGAVGRSVRMCLERTAPQDVALPVSAADLLLLSTTPVMYRRTSTDIVDGFVGLVEANGTAAVAWVEEPTGQVWLTADVPLHLSGPVPVNACVLLSPGDADVAP